MKTMMIHKSIKTIGDPVLREISGEIDDVKLAHKELYLIMSVSMYKYGGVGLAAPQIGISKRAIIVDDNGNAFMMYNPKITWKSKKLLSFNEGCLSVPEQYGNVLRPESIKVKFQDKDGKYKHWKLTGLHARVVQHEIDHLDGILFVDHLEKNETRSTISYTGGSEAT